MIFPLQKLEEKGLATPALIGTNYFAT